MSDIDIPTVARTQRWILLAVLANVLANIVLLLAPQAVALPLFLALLLVGAAVIVCLVFLMRALQRPIVSIVLASLAQFIPLVSLLVLLVVNQRATKTLKGAGIRVGLLGARS